ncbi:MAG: NAD(P)H-hydrate dehydratase [Candidatus Marinimicrobia bacterium]|nr:NAD(P)H-hydrate dehydratase [Candidatus Neomarinimicrobiota bacterium]MCF7850537.1 NAD(P)H-hydrate dehydratase [Candidatus Neomarinimicrobiota bacterium]
MQAFLSMSANRAVDDYAINTKAIPGKKLMLNAGQAVIQEMDRYGLLSQGSRILILCGKGNNGGDGFVVARGLAERGFSVAVITVSKGSELGGDARHHFNRMKQMKLNLSTWRNTKKQREMISNADLIVDALLGTGISGSIREPYADIIEQCNTSNARIVAVDVPSGVTGDRGEVLDTCMRAELTVSMGFGKQGTLFEPARSQSGKIKTVEIGFPEDALERVGEKVLYQIEESDFPAARFTRPSASHKYSVGKVYVIAGSKGFSGAAILASIAALKSGAGLVKLAIPASLGAIAESASLETILEYLPETIEGSISIDALDQLKQGAEWADVVVIGPGMGRDDETQNLVQTLIGSTDCPMVIDADALFAIKDRLEILTKRTSPSILTPHLGEFLRLVPEDSVGEYPYWEAARDFATKYQTHVLLKGAPSLITDPEGRVIINNSGHPGMSTAGSGDVLSGVLGGLWSQWPDDPEILNFAVFIHGKAADHMRSSKGVLGMIAGDILDALPTVLKEYGGLPT